MTMPWLVCNAFIEKKAHGQTKSFFSFLSPKLQKELSSLHSSHEEIPQNFDQTQDLLNRVHLSWFVKILRPLPKYKVSLFLSLFSNEQRKQLQKELLFSEKLANPSCFAKKFLQQQLVQELLLKDQNDLLPVYALPSSPLLCLLPLSSKELHTIVRFLGLRDLAVELTKIIDKGRIQQIHALLTPEQRAFLLSLMQKREPLTFKKMDLPQIIREDILSQQLHKRGMNRLSKALYPEHSHLVWYITHQMPEEEALLFFSLHKPLDSERAYAILTQQVTEIVSYLPKPTHPNTQEEASA